MSAIFSLDRGAFEFRVMPTLNTAIEQAGVRNDGRSTAWLGCSYLMENLLFADYCHAIAGNKRKFGDDLPLTHEIWGAHRSYNFPGNEELRIIPITIAAAFISHDNLENLMITAQRLGLSFDCEEGYKRLAMIWRDSAGFGAIRKCVEYKTDPMGLSFEARMVSQINKSFDSTGCKIGPHEQIVGFYDKLHHVVADAAARKAGKLPDTALPKQIHQALIKSFVMAFPIIRRYAADAIDEYQEALDFLRRENTSAQKKLAPTSAAVA